MALSDLVKRKKSNIVKSIIGMGLLFVLAACPGGVTGPKVDLTKPVKVALLVPSGGSDGGINLIGSSIMRGALLAQAERNSGDIEIITFETGGSPANAANMALEAKAQGASIILGTLKSTEAIAVSQVVKDIPIWTFSNNSEVAGGNVYLFGTSFDVIANRIVTFTKAQGHKTLGIIATDDIGGVQGMEASKTAAKKNGMKVVYAVNYPLNVSSIQQNAPGIAAALKAAAPQAVMFTDTPGGGLGFMTNALNAQGYTSGNSQYIGLSRWDDLPGFVAQAKVEGGYFVAPDLGALNGLNARLFAANGGNSHSLAGLGYDGVSAIIALVKTAKQKGDNTPFDKGATSSISFPGVMGAFRFDKNNQANRALTILQVQGGRSVVVSPSQSSM